MKLSARFFLKSEHVGQERARGFQNMRAITKYDMLIEFLKQEPEKKNLIQVFL